MVIWQCLFLSWMKLTNLPSNVSTLHYLMQLLEKQWLIVTQCSMDEILWLQKVIACIYVWLTPLDKKKKVKKEQKKKSKK